MIRSMTGFGRAERHADGADVVVELKAVNHRFLELGFRVPRSAAFLEERLKSFLQARVARGKLDVSVTLELPEALPAAVEINRPYAEAYVAALRELAEEYDLSDRLTAAEVARVEGVLRVRRQEMDEEAVWAAVQPVAEEALARFTQMRSREGEKLAADVQRCMDVILDRVAFVEARSPETVCAYRARLEQKMRELLGDVPVDEPRLLTETAVFADKIAVAEETVRLRSHLEQASQLLREDAPAGRKLDFLVQEMNREANTIGSKAQDVPIARAVVDIKAEIEKIREQIQNIE